MPKSTDFHVQERYSVYQGGKAKGEELRTGIARRGRGGGEANRTHISLFSLSSL